MIRQGDILLKRIEKLPNGLKEKDNVLALGEATGHFHKIENAKVMVDNKGNQFVIAEQDTKLIHQEHENLKVVKGNYAVIQQREFDVVEGIRQVQD